MVFTADAFGDYSLIGSERKAEALATYSEALKKEDRTIIKKMRCILDTNVHTEVDYNEAAKNTNVVLVL